MVCFCLLVFCKEDLLQLLFFPWGFLHGWCCWTFLHSLCVVIFLSFLRSQSLFLSFTVFFGEYCFVLSSQRLLFPVLSLLIWAPQQPLASSSVFTSSKLYPQLWFRIRSLITLKLYWQKNLLTFVNNRYSMKRPNPWYHLFGKDLTGTVQMLSKFADFNPKFWAGLAAIVLKTTRISNCRTWIQA